MADDYSDDMMEQEDFGDELLDENFEDVDIDEEEDIAML